MTASRLRAVAADMRAKAKAATPGPWSPPDDFGVIRAGYGSEDDGALVHGEDCGCGGGIGYAPDAAYIAAMHPAVALALADWLDAVDAQVEASGENPGGVLPDQLRHALALCDAYEPPTSTPPVVAGGSETERDG